jgi:hypothetical protein
MVVEDDFVIVDLIDKYASAVLLDEDESDTYMVRAVQHDERKGIKYYKATCVRPQQGEGGSWAVPSSSFVTGSDVVKENPILGCALMDLTASGAPLLLSDVDDMTSAHSAREAALEKVEGGSKKRGGNGGKAPRKGSKRHRDQAIL